MKLRTIIIILFCLNMSVIGTIIGAFLSISVKKPSRTLLGKSLGFSGGIMLTMTFCELIPEAIKIQGINNFMVFFSLGVLVILIISYISTFCNKSNNIRIAMMVALGFMLHNFPEGLIMGLGFMAGNGLGIKMSILIAMHDIPEGIAVAAPLLYSNVKKKKVMLYVLATTMPALIGAIIGIAIGAVSPFIMASSLSLAAGIMSYVVLFEIIPESREIIGVKGSSIYLLLGALIGILMIKFF